MRLNNVKQVNEFMDVVNNCTGSVWVESVEGDRINLKSGLSQYLAVAALINNYGGELELFCGSREDEALFYKLFDMEPDMI